MDTASRAKYTVTLRVIVSVFAWVCSVGLVAAEDACTGRFYADITGELDKAYVELKRPTVNFNNLGIVKDMAVSRLEATASQWPKDATFSISVLSDSISVVVFCKAKQKKGEWKPAGN